MYLNASFLLTSVVIPVKFPRPLKEAAEHRVGVLSRCSYLFRAEDTSHSAE